MSSQFYSVTMGFMILAAVPVLAIKYHNSHGNVNKVQVKNQPEIPSASKADNQPDNSAKGGPDPVAQMNNRMVQNATRSMNNTGVARSQNITAQPVRSQQRNSFQAVQNPAARSLNNIGNNMSRQSGSSRPQGSNILRQSGSRTQNSGLRQSSSRFSNAKGR